MKLYIGTKQIKATPMNRLAYNELRGWQLPSDENGDDKGYLVEYLDRGEPNVEGYAGYVSWSPEPQFENAYKEDGNFTFGDAVMLMKLGKKVARAGWNGKDMFAFYVSANSYPASWGANLYGVFPDDMVPYRHYLALKTAQDDVATWAPSTSDALADDWCIVE